MGILKKIFKPVSKVLDKIIPNEIKPALPYLAAFTPFLAPTSGIFGTMAGRAALSGGANIFAQLAQEGTTEDDLNLLSAGIAAATGALSAPGAGDKLSGMTTAGKLEGAPPGMADRVLSNRNILQKGIDLGLTGASKAADFLSAEKMSGGVGDILRPGGTKMGFDAATATAVGIPTAQGVGDAMYTDAVILQKQQIIDDALAAAELLEDAGARGDAIRNAMKAYGFFTDDEIESTVSSAGYKAGGRVGAEEGGLMNLGGKEMDLRGGGFVPIGKKERADDVPARLSKNEFVMTADAVRAAGGGSVNKGAKRMYDLMNNLEARV